MGGRGNECCYTVLGGSVMPKRKNKRIQKNLLVNISYNGFDGLGLVLNLSRNGVYVESREVFPRNTNLSLIMAVGNDLIPLQGKVIWTRSPQQNDLSKGKGGMGIQIGGVSSKYERFLGGITDLN